MNRPTCVKCTPVLPFMWDYFVHHLMPEVGLWKKKKTATGRNKVRARDMTSWILLMAVQTESLYLNKCFDWSVENM